MVVHLRPNSTELRLRLDPPGLGELRLRFVYEAGRVRARVRASEPATVELLRSHAGDLGRAMRDAGIDLSDLDVHEDRPRGRALPVDAADDAPARRSQRSEPAAETQRTEIRPARRPHAGAVDLFV